MVFEVPGSAWVRSAVTPMTPSDPKPASVGVRLNEWAADSYSQGGEDGMIAELLRRLGIEHGVCVEVGAHDGFTFSNTARLWHDLGWRGVLIEPHPGRHRQLIARSEGRDTVVLRRAVATEGEDCLSALLLATGTNPQVDVLSIDVDGDDIGILRSLPPVRARILVVEYNPTIPWDVEAEGVPGTPTGCSLGSLVRAAEEQGYRLAGVTKTNGIFVSVDDATVLDDLKTDPAALVDRSSYTYVVTDYRGRSTIVGPTPFRFHPGSPAFTTPIGRREVRVRWTPNGVVDAARWRFTNVARRLAGMSVRELRELLSSRVRRR